MNTTKKLVRVVSSSSYWLDGLLQTGSDRIKFEKYSFKSLETVEEEFSALPPADLWLVGFRIFGNMGGGDMILQKLHELGFNGKVIRVSIVGQLCERDALRNPIVDNLSSKNFEKLAKKIFEILEFDS